MYLLENILCGKSYLGVGQAQARFDTKEVPGSSLAQLEGGSKVAQKFLAQSVNKTLT